jgi:hypothetical protein
VAGSAESVTEGDSSGVLAQSPHASRFEHTIESLERQAP